MPLLAHISCRPWSSHGDQPTGCFVVCAEHRLHESFGTSHDVARAACIEHNAVHHHGEGRRRSPLLSVVYESVAIAGLSGDELADLLASARRRNRAAGITGMLLTEGGLFLQALEGPTAAVENLLRSIQRDPRHKRMRVLSREHPDRRRFPDWAMAEGHLDEIESRPLSQYYEALLLARAREAASAGG